MPRRAEAGAGGADLARTDTGVAGEDRIETAAGRVSVLPALRAAANFAIDLRGHDPQRAPDQGYAGNRSRSSRLT